MNKVTLKELKEDLSFWILKVIQGEVLQLTKHNKPVAMVSPIHENGLLVGKRVGKGRFLGVIKRSLHGKSLAYLQEDRRED